MLLFRSGVNRFFGFSFIGNSNLRSITCLGHLNSASQNFIIIYER